MARIPMTNGFTTIPEGTYTFRIYDVIYDPKFGKIEIKMVTAKGLTHIQRYNLMNADGTMNEKSCNMFSYFAKNALNQFDMDEIDHSDLLNHFIQADVVHNVKDSTKEEGKTVTFVNINNFAPTDDFDETPTEKALTLGSTPTQPKQVTSQPAPTAQPTGSVDLTSLLG